MIFRKQKQKVFCIGYNKTGTTTLEKVLKDFGYAMGNQIQGELLIDDWYQRNFKSIIKFCKSAEAFQDIPFSLPFTFIMLDQHFKDAKFILSERDSPEQWYHSLTTFHSKLWSDGKLLPNCEELKAVTYRYKGYVYNSFKLLYNTKDEALYKKEVFINAYKQHNYLVKEYFRSRPEKLLVINVSRKNDYFKLCDFLEKEPISDDFP